MKFRVNDVTLSVVMEGDERAPPVLLLHGFPDSSKLWSGQARIRHYMIEEGMMRNICHINTLQPTSLSCNFPHHSRPVWES